MLNSRTVALALHSFRIVFDAIRASERSLITEWVLIAAMSFSSCPGQEFCHWVNIVQKFTEWVIIVKSNMLDICFSANNYEVILLWWNHNACTKLINHTVAKHRGFLNGFFLCCYLSWGCTRTICRKKRGEVQVTIDMLEKVLERPAEEAPWWRFQFESGDCFSIGDYESLSFYSSSTTCRI